MFLHTLTEHRHPVLTVGYTGANMRIILNWLLKSAHVYVLRWFKMSPVVSSYDYVKNVVLQKGYGLDGPGFKSQ